MDVAFEIDPAPKSQAEYVRAIWRDLRTLRHEHEALRTDVSAIKEQTTLTNGRVTRHDLYFKIVFVIGTVVGAPLLVQALVRALLG